MLTLFLHVFLLQNNSFFQLQFKKDRKTSLVFYRRTRAIFTMTDDWSQNSVVALLFARLFLKNSHIFWPLFHFTLHLYTLRPNTLICFTIFYGQIYSYTKLNETLFSSKLSDKFTSSFKSSAFYFLKLLLNKFFFNFSFIFTKNNEIFYKMQRIVC